MSKTYIAAAVSLLAFIAQALHTELPYGQEEIVNAVSIIVAVGGFIWTIYERFKKGDVTVLGKKNAKPTKD